MATATSVSLALLIAGAAPGEVSTIAGLGPALTACFRPPENSAGSELTVRFSIDSRGAVIGKPAITFSRLVGSAEQKRAFVEAALSSLQRCTPLHVTPGLGGAIAGRPLSLRFIGRGSGPTI